jgi:hypothetical protein
MPSPKYDDDFDFDDEPQKKKQPEAKNKAKNNNNDFFDEDDAGTSKLPVIQTKNTTSK